MTASRNRRGNLGDTSLRLRRRNRDPMRDFDRLPPELRRWVAQAALPWSPQSCLALWNKQKRRGLPAQQILSHLDQIEAARLSRDRVALR